MLDKPTHALFVTGNSDKNELERMASLAYEWKRPDDVYTGPVNDIDLYQEWYCPECTSPLLLTKPNRAGFQSLFCNQDNHKSYFFEHCEYKFCNKEDRIHRGMWWGKSFRYPLSKQDIISQNIEAKQARLNKIPSIIKSLKQEVDQLTTEITELSASLL